MLGNISKKLKKIQPPSYASSEDDPTLSPDEEEPHEASRRSMYEFRLKNNQAGGSREVPYEEGDDEPLQSYMVRVHNRSRRSFSNASSRH